MIKQIWIYGTCLNYYYRFFFCCVFLSIKYHSKAHLFRYFCFIYYFFFQKVHLVNNSSGIFFCTVGAKRHQRNFFYLFFVSNEVKRLTHVNVLRWTIKVLFLFEVWMSCMRHHLTYIIEKNRKRNCILNVNL